MRLHEHYPEKLSPRLVLCPAGFIFSLRVIFLWERERCERAGACAEHASGREGAPLVSTPLRFKMLLLASRCFQNKIERLWTDNYKNSVNSSPCLVAEIGNRIYWPKTSHIVVIFIRAVALIPSKTVSLRNSVQIPICYANEYMKDHVFESRRKKWRHQIDHRSYISFEIQSWKKNSVPWQSPMIPVQRRSWVRNPFRPEFCFQDLISQLLNCVCNCDQSCIHILYIILKKII